MTDKELFIYTLKDELPRFERVFKAIEKIPAKKHSYKHDKKSRSAMELMVQTLGSEVEMINMFLKTGKLDFMTWKAPKLKTVADVRKKFIKDIKRDGEIHKMRDKFFRPPSKVDTLQCTKIFD